MKKPESLRAHLEQAIPELKTNPERLLIFADAGTLRSTMAQGLSFEYAYTLNLILTDYAGDIDAIAVPLFDWVRVNQSELMANLDRVKDSIKFEADLLSNGSVDLSIIIPLTERTIVKRGDLGALQISHPAEPQYTEYQDATDMTLFNEAGEILGQWTSPAAVDKYALETPQILKSQNNG